MNWTEQDILRAWEHGATVERFKADVWRKDKYGAWICRSQFGNQHSPFGWEIHPPAPLESSTDAGSSALEPLQWQNAALKSNGHPAHPVTAYGGININLDIL